MNAQINSTTPVFRTKCIVNGNETHAMIDSGASGSFISADFVRRTGIATRRMKYGGYGLTAVDGSQLPRVDSETMPLVLAFPGHTETITLDVLPMARHDIVLGTPWLEEHNPSMDWRKRVLTFERCGCVTDINPTHRQRTMVDERRMICELDHQSQQERRPYRPNSTDTAEQPAGQEVRIQGGTNAPPDIPEEFTKWKRLFQEETGADALPTHKP